MIARLLAALLLLMTLFASTTATQAQSDAPLIVVIDGDLYAYSLADGSTTRLTERPANRKEAFFFDWKDVFPSPDGRYVVYRDVPDYAADAWNNNETGNIGEFPTDLYLIDLMTGEQTTIADHPVGTRWGDGMRYRASHIGTSLAWAPDSSAFAYLESLRDGTGLRLVIYTLASATNNVAGLNSPYNIQWTPDGIRNGTRLFAADGTLLSELALHPDADPDHPVRIAGRDYLVIRSIPYDPVPGQTFLFDLVSGEYFLAVGTISTVSASAPETSLVFFNYDNDTRPDGVFTTAGVLIEREDGEAPYNVDYVIAPDGQAGAYNEAGEGARGMITFDAEGTPTLHTGMRVVAWGASLFTVSHLGAPAQIMTTDVFSTPTTCGTLESILVPGGRGVVLPGSPNRIRSAPVDGAVIGQIPAGATFDVLDQASMCGDGIWWSLVRYEDVEGWTAQGVDEYFVASVPPGS